MGVGPGLNWGQTNRKGGEKEIERMRWEHLSGAGAQFLITGECTVSQDQDHRVSA